jgi:hypothetical protein
MHKIPVITIDLRQPPHERWQRISIKLRKAACTLAGRAAKEIADERLRTLAEAVMDAATVLRNPYRADMAAWASLTGMPRRRVIVSNMAYELNQLAHIGIDAYGKYGPVIKGWWQNARDTYETIRNRAHCCTAGAAWYPGCGMTHVRAMDWNLPGLGRHSVIWRFIGASAGEYFNIGWPGYVGMISGMAPGRFSASINQAFPFCAPSLQWPPSHLLRYVFENAVDYDDAMAMLEGTPVCVPAFVMLVGVSKGQAAIVELTPRGNRVHPMTRNRPIAIANNYLSGDWRLKFGESDTTIAPHQKGAYDENRRNRMLTELNRRKPITIEKALNIVQGTDWLDNESTVQTMAFLPATGQCLVIGQEDQEPVAIGGL